MKTLKCSLILLVFFLFFTSAVWGEKLEAEDMTVVRCTSGETFALKLVEEGFAEPGQFSKDASMNWHNAEERGSIMELALPVEKKGLYSVSAGLVKYRTYGIHQFMINGAPLGRPVDMFGNPEKDAATPFTVDLGTVVLNEGENIIGLKVTGTNANTVMANNGAGIDWINVSYKGAVKETDAVPEEEVVAGKGKTYEADKLRVIRCTSGQALPLKLAEDGYAEPGLFTGNLSLHWHDADSAGSVLELALPVEKKGLYAITVGLARYRTYGIHQFMINGAPLGKPVDMFGNPEKDAVTPFSINLGTVNLKEGENVLGLRLAGTNPDTIMANNGAGIDWVRITPVASAKSPATPDKIK